MPSEESPETIAIASDHAGLELKSELKKDLIDLGFSVLALGADSLESVDYPDFGYALAGAMKEGKAKRGVLVCGSGIGISIAANRHLEIRAVFRPAGHLVCPIRTDRAGSDYFKFLIR